MLGIGTAAQASFLSSVDKKNGIKISEKKLNAFPEGKIAKKTV